MLWLAPMAVLPFITNFGIGIIEMYPSDGPVELGGAELALTGVIDAVGRPAAAAHNAYRIPADSLARVPLDAFQQRHEDLLDRSFAGEPGFVPEPIFASDATVTNRRTGITGLGGETTQGFFRQYS